MVRRRYSALAAIALATLGTAACSNPDTPIERSRVCVPLDTMDREVHENIQLAVAQFDEQERHTREAFTDIGMSLEDGHEATMFILDEEGKRIPLGMAETLVVTPDGATKHVEYPLFAAYNYTEATLGRKADGTPSFGLVAAPATPFQTVLHEPVDGQTRMRVGLDEQPLSQEQFDSLPINLQSLGLTRHAVEGEDINTSAGPRPLYQLRDRTELLANRYNSEAQRIGDALREQRERYSVTTRGCDEERRLIIDQRRRLETRTGASATARIPE